MVIRVIVASFHTFIAVCWMVSALAMLAQGVMNTSWEQAFYHQIAPSSFVMLGVGVVGLGLGLVHAIVAGAFAIGWKWAVQGLIAIAVLLIIGSPYPMNVLMGLSALAGWMELQTFNPPVDEAEEEED
jgi:hypothetical protein